MPTDAASPGTTRAASSETRNAAIHAATLSLTKIADGIVQPKLVLAWLLSAMGAPGAAIGALVPIREAGSMLPQIAMSRWVERSRLRKRFWGLGSLAQGFGALVIAASVLLVDPAIGWIGVLAGLALLSVARAACSVSQKDALARTIEKGRRGRITGLGATLGAAGALLFAAALATGLIPTTTGVLGLMVALAGGAWILAALVFQTLDEPPARDGNDGGGLVRILSSLRQDPQLARLVVVRGLLMAIALAPPFLLIGLGMGNHDGGLATLGPMMLGSGAATISSAYVWGWLSDRSSRKTLMLGGAAGGAVLAVAGWLTLTGGAGTLLSALVIYALQTAYEGVRSGRKLHLTDMATDDVRARYTAVSNTAVGVLLLAGGLFGVLSDLAGPAATLFTLAAMCALGVMAAGGLKEVQGDD